ncbi:M20 family metallopeptidase [Paraburkholderia sp. XV]|uniref:M20 family metallopeptidase n=1 Tax=Paraburkholderia sp. XV TaxID=2831520 RepID=UPI001CD6B1A7|nr:M20 family metallopeptidase [Paraburkholderia sp. XV]
MDLTKELAPFFDETRARFIELSDEIWRYAELRYEEWDSARYHRKMLEDEGFRITPDLAGMPTAFHAEAGDGGPVIAILGEFDALPGLSQQSGALARVAAPETGDNGHGCGHHLLGAGAHWAAVAVKRYLARHGLPGQIRFYGCPAEEGGSGKTFMAKAGAFDRLDAALSWHPDYETGVVTAVTLANLQVQFRFNGVASHAALAPHLGRSALDAVELMNVGVNYLREHMPGDARVHYAITNSGGASPNIVPAQAAVLYLIRSPSNETTRRLYERVCDVARGAALMTGCRVDIEFEKACSNLVFNRTLADAMHDSLIQIGEPTFEQHEVDAARAVQRTFSDDERQALLAEAGTAEMPAIGPLLAYRPEQTRLSFASSDVGDVSWVVPTAQCVTACYAYGTAFHSWQMVAQGKSALAHKGLEAAAKVLALTAIDLLSKPQRLAEAKAELIARGGGPGYQSPIPDGVAPALKSGVTHRTA